MKVDWWSCVLGLFLCQSADVTVHTWTVSQEPTSICEVTVNSSVEITCSTTLPDPGGFYLFRRFHDDQILYLNLKNGQVDGITEATEFRGRYDVDPEPRVGDGHGFTLKLSGLQVDDTDHYYCSWGRFGPLGDDRKSSNGTIIIVQDPGPQVPCRRGQIFAMAVASLSATAFILLSSLLIGALTLRCRRFKKNFRPGPATEPRRPYRPRRVSPQQRPPQVSPQQHMQLTPNMVTSVDPLDFGRIL